MTHWLLALTQPLTNVRVAAPIAAQIADAKTTIEMYTMALNADYARKGDAVPA